MATEFLIMYFKVCCVCIGHICRYLYHSMSLPELMFDSDESREDVSVIIWIPPRIFKLKLQKKAVAEIGPSQVAFMIRITFELV